MTITTKLASALLAIGLISSAHAMSLDVKLPAKLAPSASVQFSANIITNCISELTHYTCKTNTLTTSVNSSKFAQFLRVFNNAYLNATPMRNPELRQDSTLSIALSDKHYNACNVALNGKQAVAIAWNQDGSCQVS